MKLCSIICESMTWDDLTASLPGHRLVHFDPHPATMSAQSLWCMQTDATLPPARGNPHEGTSWFDGVDMISLRHPTRLISNFWPKAYDPVRIDPDVADPVGKKVGVEPDNHQWHTMQAYLANPGHHEWLIYWPTLGHAGYRVQAENKGIPKDIRETTRVWFKLMAEHLLPRLTCPTIIFSDHGSARFIRTRDEQFRNGFAFVPDGFPFPDAMAQMTWADMRALQEGILCSP